MNPKPLAPGHTNEATPETEDLDAELDALVQKAAHGDEFAIGAIAIAFGPVLLEIVRDEAHGARDEAHVLNDLFHAMREHRTVAIAPAPGQALAWLEDQLRAIARGQSPLCSRRDYAGEYRASIDAPGAPPESFSAPVVTLHPRGMRDGTPPTGTPHSVEKEATTMNRSYVDNLYRRSFRSLVKTAYSVVHNRADAEDIVQDVFFGVLQGDADHLAPGPEFDAYVTAEVVRAALAQASPSEQSNVFPLARPPKARRGRRVA